MHSFFLELGRTVRARWMAQNFSLTAFPEIARTALEERPPSEHVDVDALVREFLLQDDQPAQSQSGFGQPELIVFEDARFYIQILFWLEGTTDIHQHEFSGAFHVLAGSSLHARFEFARAESISAHLRVGELRMTETDLLETGRTVAIRSGRDYIHSLFHLETPSLTVVVRTQTDPGTGPQFTYLPPHLAVDPFHHDTLTTRRKQLLDALEKMGVPGYPALVREMIAQLDFERGFFILQNAMLHLRNLAAWDETWEVFCGRHGRLAEFVGPTLEGIIRRDTLVELRATVSEPELRFFLALLLNLPTREKIFALVAERFPGPPLETILRWAEELSGMSETATWILDAEFPPSDEPAEALAQLRELLEKPGAAVSASPFARSSLRVLFA